MPINIKQKTILTALTAFFVPLLIFIAIEIIGCDGWLFQSQVAHAIIVGLICAAAFYVAFTAAKISLSGRPAMPFYLSLAFAVFGASFLAHAVSYPLLASLPGYIFDISEHLGLALGAGILLFGLIASFHIPEIVVRNRLRVVAGAVLAFWVFLFALSYLPNIAQVLVSTTDILIALSGLAILASLVIVIRQYLRQNQDFVIYEIAGLAILINSAIIPFFYKEWMICWWYWHLVVLAGFASLAFGVFYAEKQGRTADAFVNIPFRSRIITRLLVFFILVFGVGPLVVVNYLSFSAFSTGLEVQIVRTLTVIAESKEGHVLSFLTATRNRVADFSSDGLIRDLTARITRDPGDLEAIRSLNHHLRVNKAPLDQTIYGINIVSLQGKVIASTNDVELGKDEGADDYFKNTLTLNYGETFVGEPSLSHHFAAEKNTISFSAPLFDKNSGERVGIIVNYIETSELDDLLFGRRQVRLGAFTGDKGFGETLDIYLVRNNGKLMISESRFLGKKVFMSQVADTEPVRACLEGKETEGRWTNYLGNPVYGVSMCLKNYGWTLVVEAGVNEMLQPIEIFKNSTIRVVVITIFLILLLGVFLSRRIARPIESLINTTKDIIGGNFGARVSIESRDEIGELGKSFNVMLGKLGEFTTTLSVERKKLETILDSLPMAVSIVDEKRVIQYANWVFKKTFGSKCIGEKCYLLTKDNKQICANCPLKGGIDQIVGPGIIEVDGIAGGRTYSIIHAPFEDVGGKKLIIEVFRDVTKEREIDRAKSEFISVASHQLRTPLTAINWYVEMLLTGELGALTPKQKSYLQEVYDGSKRMGSLVNDLLNLSRIESGKARPEPVSVRADLLVQKIVDDFKPVALEKKCALVFKKDNLEFPEINLDQTLFRQVIVNLLANAVAYSKEGECSVVVELHLDAKNSEIIVAVQDSGIGIPKDDQPLIFSRFFRAQNAVRRATEGTGLGLYISRLIIGSFGGRIWFESKENVGTTFFVALPLSGVKRNGAGGGYFSGGE
ncbi:MAG: HAMP domain-containing protein [Candidatus Niyogibacteria bacterium]|nr:HAMP domain-containing protein [Candidatus Niyogibacteria bacterium]